MKAKVEKWGSGLALRIPRALAEQSRLTQGSTCRTHQPSAWRAKATRAGIKQRSLGLRVSVLA